MSGETQKLERLTAALAACNKHILAFVSYINASDTNSTHLEYYVEGLEDLNDEGIALERILMAAIQPVLSDLTATDPELGAVLAASLAYTKLIIIGLSTANTVARSAALDKLLGFPIPKPIDPTKL